MAGTEARRTRQDLYLEISRDLTNDDVRNIRDYIGGKKVLPAGTIQHATVHEMFNKLERKGVLKQGELSFLVKLMKSIDRDVYADAAEEIAKQEREGGKRTRQDLYLEISRDLTDDDVHNIRDYIGGEKVLPAGTVQHATAHQMFNKLERKGVLKQGELSFLVKLMKRIDRDDYAEAAEEIAKQEREALRGRQTVGRRPSPSDVLRTSFAGKQGSAKRKKRNNKPYSRPRYWTS